MRTICVPESPYAILFVKILGVLLAIGIIYGIVNYIIQLLNGGCQVPRERYIIAEGFDGSKNYFNGLLLRCDTVDSRIKTLNDELNTMNSEYGDLSPNVCYVFNQINSTLQKNYEADVQVNSKNTQEEIDAMAAKRKTTSANYITNLKKSFVDSHGGTPLLECFDDGSNSQNSLLPPEKSGLSDIEQIELEALKATIEKRINAINANLNIFDSNLITSQNAITSDILKKHYQTLNFNDTYINQIKGQVNQGIQDGKVAAATTLAKLPGALDSVENFAGTLDFSNTGTGTNSSEDPAQRLTALEQHCVASEKNLHAVSDMVAQYTNTAAQQKTDVDQFNTTVNTTKGQMDFLKSVT
jgi:hypothetical protein